MLLVGQPPGRKVPTGACAGGSRPTPGGEQVMPRARRLLGVLQAARLATFRRALLSRRARGAAQAQMRPRASLQAPPMPVHKLPLPTEMLLEPSVGRRNSWTGVGEAWSDGRGRIILRLRRLPEHASRARRGGKSPRAQPTARPAAASRAQSPALCQVLPWTRRRKHRRGPFGPEVDQGAAPQRRKANRTHKSTCAVGSTQPSRQP